MSEQPGQTVHPPECDLCEKVLKWASCKIVLHNILEESALSLLLHNLEFKLPRQGVASVHVFHVNGLFGRCTHFTV